MYQCYAFPCHSKKYVTTIKVFTSVHKNLLSKPDCICTLIRKSSRCSLYAMLTYSGDSIHFSLHCRKFYVILVSNTNIMGAPLKLYLPINYYFILYQCTSCFKFISIFVISHVENRQDLLTIYICNALV